MSTAPASDFTPDSTSVADGTARPTPRFTAGLADRLGDRVLTFDDATATSLELLRFKHEIGDATGFEAALRDRVELLSPLRHATIGAVRSVERRGGEHLTLISKHTAGRRLSEILHAARGPAFALDFLGQVTPALVAIQQQGAGVAHGALTVDRVIVAREGRLVVVEHVLGSALATLKLSADELRRDVGVAIPDGHDSPVIDARLDVIQLGFIALTLLLGRRLDPADYPSKIGAHLDAVNAEDLAAWARLRPWLERALHVSERPFADAQEAYEAFAELTDAGGADKPASVATATRPSLVSRPGETAPQSRPLHEATPESRQSPNLFPSEVGAPGVAASRATGSRSTLTLGLAALAAIEAIVIAGLVYTRPTSVGGVTGELPRPAPIVAAAAPSVPESAAALEAQANAPAGAGIGATTAAAVPVADAAKPKEGDAALPAGARFGGVRVASPIDLQVLEDGKVLGSSAGPIAISDGPHTFELINDALGFRFKQTVQVKPGQLTNVSIAVPNGRISINAAPWADVWIDGNAAGQTPLANLMLPIGQHEIVFRHPQLGEQKQNVTVKVDGLARVSAVLQK